MTIVLGGAAATAKCRGTQTVARAYGAACTPDFFGYNADRTLKYRGPANIAK